MRMPSIFLLAASSATQVSTPSSAITLISLNPSAGSASSHAALASSVPLSGSTPLTVTFSRAVIALGSDFGAGPLEPRLTPFLLSPSVAGSYRWVTTSIARFDPATEWPPELEISLTLNPQMRAYDGASLVSAAGQPERWLFRTPKLTMRTGEVRSEAAERLTNGSWSASREKSGIQTHAP